MKAVDYSQYDFVFAVNPAHPLTGFKGYAYMNGEYIPVRVISVSGNRIPDSGLISEQKIQPTFLLEHVNESGERYIIAEYTGGLFIEWVSRAQMFGLLTRLENILGDDDVGSVTRSIASMLTDRADMLERVKAVREAIR